MNKVIIINLGGKAYHLEESGYTKLQNYLENAGVELSDNPDKEEIITDLEHAIGEKCQKFLSTHKTVVTEQEVDQVLAEMGPVEATPSSAETNEKTNAEKGEQAPRRFYLIREGSLIAGVCTGFAAYFNTDVSWIRLGYLVLFGINNILGIVAYVVPMFLLPYAKTGEEKAAARGKPFNAQELVDKARAEYEKLNKKDWKKWGADVEHNAQESWSQAQRNWREQAPYMAKIGERIGVIFAMLLTTVLTIAWFYVLFSLITTGAVLGYAFTGIPLWVTIVATICMYNMVLWPIRAIHQYSIGKKYEEAQGWYGMWDSFMWLGIIAVSLWAVYTHVPSAKEFLDSLGLWG